MRGNYDDDMIRYCHRCGKAFAFCAEWAYKRKIGKKQSKTAYFCSWSCLRQHDTEVEETEKERLAKIKEQRTASIKKALARRHHG